MLWEIQKMLVTSIFSFHHNVFKGLFFPWYLTLYQTIRVFTTLNRKAFENNKHLFLFPKCFLTYHHFSSICSLQMLSVWASPTFCPLVKYKNDDRALAFGTSAEMISTPSSPCPEARICCQSKDI